MSFLSKRTAERHAQVVRVEGALGDQDFDEQPVAIVRLDNYDYQTGTYIPIGDVAGFRTSDNPPNGRMHLRPYTQGVPTDTSGLSVTHTGKVGIGVTDPIYMLDVGGSIGCTTLYSDNIVNGYTRIGNPTNSTGVDLDVAGDVRCREIWSRRIISSAFSGAVVSVPPPTANAGTASGTGSDVSIAGTDSEGVISIVFSQDADARAQAFSNTHGSTFVLLASITLGQPMPCAAQLTAIDSAAASIGCDTYALPTVIGFDVVVSRSALSRFASGSLYRWAYTSAAIPRPPFPSRALPTTANEAVGPYPVISAGEDVVAGGLVHIIGTDTAGIVRAMFGANGPKRGLEPFGIAHVASVRFGTPQKVPHLTSVITSPWSQAAINAAVGAGVRRKPGSVAAVVLADGTGFDLLLGALDTRDYAPHAVYTWSYLVETYPDSATETSPTQPGSANTLIEAAAGQNATASVSVIRPGAGVVTLISGDPPTTDMGCEPTVPLVTVIGIEGMGSGAAVCLSAANAAAAALPRSVSALLAAGGGFCMHISSSPPHPPLWPHTEYRWNFLARGVPRPRPTTPVIWFGTGLGSGGAVRIVGTDTSGSIDVLFPPSTTPFFRLVLSATLRQSRWYSAALSTARKPAHVASVAFAVRYLHPISVQVTCSRCPGAQNTAPTPIASPSVGGAGFDIFLSGYERERVQPHAIYSWSYFVIGTSLTRR
jgi:hypothetical protein